MGEGKACGRKGKRGEKESAVKKEGKRGERKRSMGRDKERWLRWLPDAP